MGISITYPTILVKSWRSTFVLNMVSTKTFCVFFNIFYGSLSFRVRVVVTFCWCLNGDYQTNHIMHSTVRAKKPLNFTFHALRPKTSLKSGVCRMICWLGEWVRQQLHPLDVLFMSVAYKEHHQNPLLWSLAHVWKHLYFTETDPMARSWRTSHWKVLF